jgi:hypothetical protein
MCRRHTTCHENVPCGVRTRYPRHIVAVNAFSLEMKRSRVVLLAKETLQKLLAS